MKKFIAKIWYCYIWKYHDWTSKSMQGDVPDYSKNFPEFKKVFYDNCRMYCKRCGVESKLSEKFKQHIGL